MRVQVVLLLAILLAPLAATDLWSKPGENVIVIESADVETGISREQASNIYIELAQELKIANERLPRIVIFHVSKQTGKKMRVQDVEVRRNIGDLEASGYYEVWLVGNSDARACIVALENVLEGHFQLAIKDEERDSLMRHVLVRTDSTISARASSSRSH